MRTPITPRLHGVLDCTTAAAVAAAPDDGGRIRMPLRCLAHGLGTQPAVLEAREPQLRSPQSAVRGS